jgi:CubicO group peptidase (beta-lactamase class C family)
MPVTPVRLAVGLALLVAASGCSPLEVETSRWEHTPETCPSGVLAPWKRATPEEVGLASAPLEEVASLASAGDLGNVHGILVVRDGRLVLERYFTGSDESWGEPLGQITFTEETFHDLRSVTKSVVGALVGIALGEGLLPDIDAALVDLLPGRADDAPAQVRQIRVRHALTMTAGLEWDERMPYWWPWNDEIEMWRSDDPVGFVLSRAVQHPPGRRFAYNGGLPTALAAAVEASAHQSMDLFAAQRLFCPLGVEAFEWKRHPGGIHIAASGLRLRPRDWARFGWMMLSGGRWGGRQIVPAGFVHDSLRTQIDTGGSIEPGYGFLWWMTGAEASHEDPQTPVAVGYGGQRIFLLLRERSVVVVTAGEYGALDQDRAGRRVVAAVREAERGFPPDP